MKKYSIIVLCCLVVFTSCFLFTGCKSEIDKFKEIPDLILELQNVSNMTDDLNNDKIYLEGSYRGYSSGSYYNAENYEISLNDIVVTENAIIDTDRNYIWMFVKIKSIKNKNGNILWSI